MKNILIIDEQKAVISFDPEINLFRGEFIGLNGGADFYASSIDNLITEGKKSLDIFMQECSKKGIDPYRQFSGKFNVRLSPKLHEAAVIAAQANQVSLNEWISNNIAANVGFS